MKRFYKQISLALILVMLLSLAGVAEDGLIIEDVEILPEGFSSDESIIIEELAQDEQVGKIELNEFMTEKIDAPDIGASDMVSNASIPKTLTLGVKETYALKYDKATFNSSRKSVATVNKKGVVTAKKKGSAKITVKAGGKMIATCVVTVLAAPKKVTLDQTKLTLPMGSSMTIKAILPKKTASNKLTWKSSNKKIVKVDKNGVLTPVKPGKAKITVITFNNKKATCTVTVTANSESSIVYPESAHPHSTDEIQNWFFTWPTEAEALSVTFSSKTSFSPEGAHLYIIDSTGESKSFTGKELSAKTVILPGNSFQLKLRPWYHSGRLSDYGFAIDDIHAVTESEYKTYLAEQTRNNPFETAIRWDGTLVINGYRGRDSVLEIPEEIDGVKVTAIDQNAFKNNKSIVSVTISESIKDIYEAAFSGCKKLKTVILSDSLTYIADDVFHNCKKLKEVIAHENTYAFAWAVEHGYIIPEATFSVWPLVDDGDVTWEDGIQVWQHLDPDGKTLSFTVNAPDSWTVIWDKDAGIISGGAIDSGTVLSSEVKTIRLYLNWNESNKKRTGKVQFCCGDQTITIKLKQLPCMSSKLLSPTSLAKWTEGKKTPRFDKFPIKLVWEAAPGAKKYILYIYDYECGIPSGIEWAATKGKTTSVTLDKGFFEDLLYKNFDVQGFELAIEDEWGHRSFNTVYPLSVILDKNNPDYDYEFVWNDETNELAGVKIKRYHGEAKKLTIPMAIGGYPVYSVSGFYNCNSLTKVTIPEGVKHLAGFENCINLTNIVLPASLTSISDTAFSGCTALKKVNAVPGSMAYNWAVRRGFIKPEDEGLTTKVLADGTLEITGYTGRIDKLVIPSEIDGVKVTSIGSCAFLDDDTLESVVIQRGVLRIGHSAFRNCKNLKAIKLPKGMAEIGSYAFVDCSNLTGIKLREGLNSIGVAAFDSTGLLHVEIPEGTKTINDFAFCNCGSLESVYIHEGPSRIELDCFSCEKLSKIYIPQSVAYIAPDSLGWDNKELLTIYGRDGSYAQRWAKENGYAFVAGQFSTK